MAELLASDVETFTNGRLADNDATQAMLDAALLVARRDVGWHVSPVKTAQIVVLDGPDSRMLNLPTRKLTALTSITEDGVLLDLTKLTWTPGGPPGLLERSATVRKKSCAYWSREYQAITVVMDHGYTEAEAADWRQAILLMVDQMSLLPVGGGGFSTAGMTYQRVDDVQYRWATPYTVMADNTLISVANILDDYRLPRVEFF